MSDTPISLDRNCALAHYPSGVATPKRRRNAELTPEQQQSIEKVRAAARELEEARAALDKALARRAAVIREEWVAQLSELGAMRVAREVGADLMGEGTVRGLTTDLRARERAQD